MHGVHSFRRCKGGNEVYKLKPKSNLHPRGKPVLARGFTKCQLRTPSFSLTPVSGHQPWSGIIPIHWDCSFQNKEKPR